MQHLTSQTCSTKIFFWGPCRVVFRTFGNLATRFYTFVLGLGSECGLAWKSGCEFGMDLQALWVGGTWWLNIGLIGGEIGPVDILDYSLFWFQHVKFGKMDIDSIWFIGGLIQKAVNCHGKESLNCCKLLLHLIRWIINHQASSIFWRTGSQSRHQDHQLKSTQLNYNKLNQTNYHKSIHQVITSISSGVIEMATKLQMCALLAPDENRP